MCVCVIVIVLLMGHNKVDVSYRAVIMIIIREQTNNMRLIIMNKQITWE